MKVLARTSPASGTTPTLAPGGKIGSAAQAGFAAMAKRATANNRRKGVMKESTGFALRRFGGRPVRPKGPVSKSDAFYRVCRPGNRAGGAFVPRSIGAGRAIAVQVQAMFSG